MDARPSPGARAASRRLRLFGATALAAILGCVAAPPARAQSSAPQPPRIAVSIADLIADASQRFDVPATWIAAVIRAESAFDPRATSPKGAMGLMQLMPDTWAALRARLGLGLDPYDPRDNILAGARYLRDLYDQFGAGGFLAAYNAGPRRYLDLLANGRPLPPETRAYVVNVTTAIDGGAAIARSVRASVAIPPRSPEIFVALSGTQNSAAPTPAPRQQATAGSSFVATPSTPGALFAGAWGRTVR
jgi:soluble lytic murein transglycosylase-like protein